MNCFRLGRCFGGWKVRLALPGRSRGTVGEIGIRVLVVDDYAPMRRLVAAKLKTLTEIRFVHEAANGLEAVEQARELQPDLILMDIGLPLLNGIEATREIRRICPASKILFASANRSPDVVEESLRSGGLGYVLKSDAQTDLLPAISAALRGERFLS